MLQGPLLLLVLAGAVLYLIIATSRLKWHPFLVLLTTAYGLGLLVGLSPQATAAAVAHGFGTTMGKIGIVIAAGTILGTFLERGGGARVLAVAMLERIGKSRAAAAMSLTGAAVSIPVFCDSGFVILAPLCRSLGERSGVSRATFAVAVGMGLYTTHVFVPPTPGPIAAAGTLGADVGMVMILGLVTTVPVLITTNLFAQWMGDGVQLADSLAEPSAPENVTEVAEDELPSPGRAALPILAPMFLMALRAVASLEVAPFGAGAFAEAVKFLGDPNTALLVGLGLVLLVMPRRAPEATRSWVEDGLGRTGSVLLVTGAGGALGAVLQATPLAKTLQAGVAAMDPGSLGLLLPFLIAAAFKTTLGSSTVAIITTASIVAPLLGSLELAGGYGPALATLAIGAGAMTVSHANDSYFWVVSQFSGMSVRQAYQLHTLGSLVAGTTGITVVLGLRFLLA